MIASGMTTSFLWYVAIPVPAVVEGVSHRQPVPSVSPLPLWKIAIVLFFPLVLTLLMMFMLRNKNDDFKDFYFMAFPSAATIYVAFCRETLKLSQPGKNELSGALLAYAGFILEILLCYGTSAELCRRSSSTRCLWAELTEYP